MAKPRKFSFPKVEPWPNTVNGIILAEELMQTFQRYLVLPDDAPETMTAWTMFTWTFEAWQCSPRLVFSSRQPECGKTTALSLLSKLCPKPLTTVNITSAALFRIIERDQPTMMIDEADTFMEGDDALRGVLNSGHTRDTAFVWRCNPETNEPEGFSTWSPICIGKIGGLPATLASRSLIMYMRRKTEREHVVRFTPAEYGHVLPLARKLARWGSDNLEALQSADPELPSRVSGRMADNWRPLVAIGDHVGGRFKRLVRAAAVRASRGEANPGNQPSEQTIAAVLAFVATRYSQTGKPVPEHVVREMMLRFMPKTNVGELIKQLMNNDQLRLGSKVTNLGRRVFVPGEPA